MIANTDDNEPRLAELLLRWEEFYEQGQSLSADELCSTCPELAGELARRIALLRKMDPLLGKTNTARGDPAPVTLAGASRRESATARADFRDLRFHAAGALGEVFMARNAELNRDVALKFLKPDRARDADSLRRFLQEAEVTGRLEHPGVVPIYALGTDGSGAPCYAMRFIRGETLQDPIDAFHAAEKPGRDPSELSLALRELLNRFVSICSTMAYAHSRGILHRDLKPRNVMLGKYDETLVVDWGLAKPFDRNEAARSVGEETLMPGSGSGDSGSDTPTVGVVGTPAYMSPEQAEARWDRVGPASDLFSLGAILYAILTGRVPYQGRTIGEVMEKVKRCEFPAPRQVKPGVSRALEAVCLKAMAPKPEERYATALDLAADIRRWLAGEPVTAYAEPSAARARRWMRRHRTLATTTAAVLVLGLIGLAGFATVLAGKNRELDAMNAELRSKNQELDRLRRTAEDQRNRAVTAERVARDEEAKSKKSEAETKAVLEFFQTKVLAAARPKDQEGGLGIDATIREAVDAAEPAIEKTFADQPTVAASIRNTLGGSYHYLGEPALAIGQHERALALRRQSLGPDHVSTLESMAELALTYRVGGRLADALPLLQDALIGFTAKRGPDHPDTLTTMNNLAVAYEEAGRLAEALALKEETLKRRRAKLGPDHPDTLTTMNNLAAAYLIAGRLAEALPLFEDTLSRQRAKLGPDHPDTLRSMNNLAVAYEAAGRLAEALDLQEETLKRQRAKLGPDHPDTLRSMNNLAVADEAAGRLAEALALKEETLKRQRAKLGPDHPDTLRSMNNLAVAYEAAGRLAEALDLQEETLKRQRAKFGPDHPGTLISMNNLAMAYKHAGRFAEALPLYEETLRRQRAKLGPDHPDTSTLINNLAMAYQAAGRLAEALPLFEETLKGRRARLGPDHPDILISMNNLAAAYVDSDRLAEALPLFEETLKGRRTKLGPDHPDTLRSMNNLAEAYQAAGRLTNALPLHEEALKGRRAKLGPDHRDTLQSMNNLARAYLRAGIPDQGEPLLRQALSIRARKTPDDWLLFDTYSLLGDSLLGPKKYEEAESLLLKGYQGMRACATKIPARYRKRLTEALTRIVALYDSWGKSDKAEEWRRRLGENQMDRGFPAEPFAK